MAQDLAITLGAIEIGIIINSFLYGVMLMR